MKLGDIIQPTEQSGFILRSGAQQFNKAVVISIDPFIITSEDSYMKWQMTIKKEYFQVIGKVDESTLEKCKSRLTN